MIRSSSSEYAKKYPHLLDEHGNITISVWWGISTPPKLLVSTAMPTLEFPENKLSPIKSLRVTVGSYEDDSEQLLHYMHKKTEI